jgi:hypothetical protein
MQNILFLVEGQTIVLGNATLKVVDITDSNTVKFDVVCQWKYNDTLTHSETVAEGGELVYDVSPNYFRLIVRSVVNAASFSFINIAADYDKTEDTGNLALDLGRPLFVKGASTGTITYTAPLGGKLVITKPSGATLVDTPALAGAHTYTILPSGFDEIGMWKATVMEAGTTPPQLVKVFRVVALPATYTHVTDIVFRSPSYQSTEDTILWVQTFKEKLNSELAEVCDHFNVQYTGSSAATNSDQRSFTLRILANLGTSRDAELIMCVIADMLSLINAGSPVGYITTRTSSSTQNKVTFTVADVLALLKASTKTKFDRLYEMPTSVGDIAGIAASEKKLYADVFPSATIDPMANSVNSISTIANTLSITRPNAITQSKTAFMDATRTVEDSVTTAYSVHDVPLEHVTTEVTTTVPGTEVTAQTGARATNTSMLPSLSSVTSMVKENWKIASILVVLLVIAVIMKAKGKNSMNMVRKKT